MIKSTHSRRSRAFRPAIIGLDRLEERKLLTGAAILPDPTVDFDPDNVTLVDLTTFKAHLAERFALDVYNGPGVLDGADAADLPTLYNILDVSKGVIIETINNRIADVVASLNFLIAIKNDLDLKIQNTETLIEIAMHDEELVIQGQLQEELEDLQDGVKDVQDQGLIHLGEIEFLQQLRDMVEDSAVEQRAKIYEVNLTADPSNPPVYWYYAPPELIA